MRVRHSFDTSMVVVSQSTDDDPFEVEPGQWSPDISKPLALQLKDQGWELESVVKAQRTKRAKAKNEAEAPAQVESAPADGEEV